MPLSLGPKTYKQGNLVFSYDLSDTTNSYIGEPTTNLVPSPEHNGQFTTSNGWSTYNTNQYNGAQYFSIGTIGSVTNNIVTLSSVGRNIRSFDVLRAQTTGGGVTAGTDYVIKKISSTTFSLHTYNGSQDGSQGYINPSTNFFKVHDAYATDTRVPIDATNFPTMWWGAPHLPNSGLIKEIVPNGGRRKGTNCMRLHAYRGDGVVDGMAYGVYCPVNVNDIITMSVWIKLVDNRNPTASLGYSTYFNAGFSAGATTFSNLTTEWQKFEYTWTSSNTFSFYSYWWPSGASVPYAIDIADFQVEVNKGHSTPFVAGNRSSTQSLFDVSGNRTLNVSDVSFDSNGEMEFDGTNDFLSVGSFNLYSMGNSTLEAVIYMNNLSSPDSSYSIFGGISDEGYHGYHEIRNSGSGYKMTYWTSTDGWRYGNTSLSSGTWYHVTWVWNHQTLTFYLNGVADGSFTFTTFSPYGLGFNRISSFPNERYMNGKIPVAKVYSTSLSATDVLKSFNNYKKRYNM